MRNRAEIAKVLELLEKQLDVGANVDNVTFTEGFLAGINWILRREELPEEVGVVEDNGDFYLDADYDDELDIGDATDLPIDEVDL